MADTPDSKSGAFGRVGSSPTSGTKIRSRVPGVGNGTGC